MVVIQCACINHLPFSSINVIFHHKPRMPMSTLHCNSHRLCVYHYDMQQGLKRFLRLLPPLECNDSNAKPSPKEPLCLSVGLSTEQPSPPENGHIPPSKMEQVSSSETEQVSPSETEQVSKSMEGLSPSKMWQISRSVMGQVPSSVIEQVSSEMGLLSLPKMRQISPPVMGLVTPSELEQVSSELGQLSPSQVGQMSSDTRKRPELKWELAKLDEQRSNMVSNLCIQYMHVHCNSGWIIFTCNRKAVGVRTAIV